MTMKIGIIVETLRLPLFEGLAKAKSMGAAGVQMYAVQGERNFLEMNEEQMAEVKAECDKHGLVVSAVCCDLGGHGFADPAGNPERIAKTKGIVDKAIMLDCHVLTTHIGVVDPTSGNYEAMVAAMREAGEYALSKGVTLAIETGPEPATTLKKFLADIDCAGVGINLDPANLAMVCRDDPAAAVRLLGSAIVHTHAKDGINLQPVDPRQVYASFADGGFEKLEQDNGKMFREVPLGEGDVDWDDYFAALNEIGFDGFLTIERECGDQPQVDIAMAVDFLKARI